MVERVARREAHKGRFAADDRGQLLILTGVLMVLGFVIIGSTLVQLQAIEEKTARTQRDALLDPVDALVASFNETVQDSVTLGDTNVTDFMAQMVEVEGRMRATATRGGMYLSAELEPDPDTEIFWRESRCGAYIHAYTQGGVVIGYEKDSQVETIAGAVYNVHVTDGRQSIRMPYYVRIYECMSKDTVSFLDGLVVTLGSETNDWLNARAKDDGLTSSVGEEQEGETLTPGATATADAASITQNRWSSEGNIVGDDLSKAQHASADSDDYLRWEFAPPAGFDTGDWATGVTIRIDHWHTPQIFQDDTPLVTVTHNAQSLMWTPGVSTSQQSYTWTFPLSPSGDANWTYDEIVNAQWEYSITEVVLKDPGRTWWVDYVEITFTKVEVQGHQMDIEADWPAIPLAYSKNTLAMRYQWTPAPTAESLSVTAWNYTTGAWGAHATDQYTFVDTAGGYVDATLSLHKTHHLGSSRVPQFRFTDSSPNDNIAPADLDVLVFDYLAVESEVTA